MLEINLQPFLQSSASMLYTNHYNGNYFCVSALQPGIIKIPLTLKTAYYSNVK